MRAVEPSSEQPAKLASHVCICQVDDQIVLLDLRRNRYLSIGAEGASALAHHVEGWSVAGECADAKATPFTLPASRATSALIQRLMQQGLLTRERAVSRDATRAEVLGLDEPTESIDFAQGDPHSSGSLSHVARFLRSAAVAALWLQCRSLESIAAAVASRGARIERSMPNARAPETVCRSATAYARLRPFGFTAEDRCLRDSLALTNYLAAEGALARWVIGVKIRPFGAHSWVQSGAIVLNDQPDHVRRYTPILVV
jgi:hypothetical protein